MTELPASTQPLTERLAPILGPATAGALAAALLAAGRGPAVLTLLDELADASGKVRDAAVAALPDLQRRAGLADVVSWLDLCVALAQSSGAAAIKLTKESPLLLGLLEPAQRRPVLAAALEVAEQDASMTVEWLRVAPELLRSVPADRLRDWAEVAVEVAQQDYVLGVELLKQAAAVAAVLPIDHVRTWAACATRLVTVNSLGKTDYLGTLEFFRTSPALLGDIPDEAARVSTLAVGSALAQRDPQTAVVWLAEAPGLLRRLPSDPWRAKVLQYAGLVADQDAPACLAYLRRAPDMLALLGEQGSAAQTFDEWYRAGMETLAYSSEGARAYFALETNKALATVTEAMSSVPLRHVARSLKLFAQGLCGRDIAIASLPEAAAARAALGADGRTILLPALLKAKPSREANVRLYLVMAAHEAGHLEFGTYDVPLEQLADLGVDVCRRYGRPDSGASDIRTLEQLFACYPRPALIRDLWTVVEDARVERRLEAEYPGLAADLAHLTREEATTRSLLHGMTVRELTVDALLLLSTQDRRTIRIPDTVAAVIERAWDLAQSGLAVTAAAADAVRAADRIYAWLDEAVGARGEGVDGSPSAAAANDEAGTGPSASDTGSGYYRAVTNWTYRGQMNPELVRDRSQEQAGGAGPNRSQDEPQEAASPVPEGLSAGFGGGAERRGRDQLTGQQSGEALAAGGTPRDAVEEMLAVGDERREAGEPSPAGGRSFVYDEWDGAIQDYRTGWCRVTERPGDEGAPDAAEAVLAAHGPAVRLLRRRFEALRPSGFRRVRARTDGEELDLDAVVAYRADRAAGADPSDRLYLRREKRDREVAAAFLVDVSGSTSRQIEGGDPLRRVIDVEKEGLVLLCEALRAVGDQHAVYGYSGQGRRGVDFLVIKDFDDPAGARTARRLGALAPRQQNRDGAAIRHAVRKLLACPAKVRLLFLISDGRPLDDGYAEDYALADTKMALREARLKGIHPFCLTVDRTADDYLRRMYGDVRYLVIDDVRQLPERLPRLYERVTA